jgi:hypothetical protein
MIVFTSDVDIGEGSEQQRRTRTILCQYQTTVEAFDEKNTEEKTLSDLCHFNQYFLCVCTDGFQGLSKAFHCAI